MRIWGMGEGGGNTGVFAQREQRTNRTDKEIQSEEN